MQQAIIFVLVVVLLAIITNLIIYMLGWNKEGTQQINPLLPPGWAIGLIWTFIFGVLGFAMHLALQLGDTLSMVLIGVLIAACLAYPFYTSGLDAGRAARIGNTSTLIGAFITTITIALRSPNILPYLVPILIWSSYVNIGDAIRYV